MLIMMNNLKNVGMMSSIQIPTRNEKIEVNATSEVILETKNLPIKRHSYILRNMSLNEVDIITIHIGYGEAVSGEGIVLKKGESVSESISTDTNDVWSGQISAICDTADGLLSVFERDI